MVILIFCLCVIIVVYCCDGDNAAADYKHASIFDTWKFNIMMILSKTYRDSFKGITFNCKGNEEPSIQKKDFTIHMPCYTINSNFTNSLTITPSISIDKYI